MCLGLLVDILVLASGVDGFRSLVLIACVHAGLLLGSSGICRLVYVDLHRRVTLQPVTAVH